MKGVFSSCGHYFRLGRGVKAKPLGCALRSLDPAPESELGAAKREKQSEQLLSYGGNLPAMRPGSLKEPISRWGSQLAKLRYERTQHWVSDHHNIDRHG